MYALIDNQGRRFSLDGDGPWLVGRHSRADVGCGDDPYCARRQFELRFDGDALVIEPLSETSTTYLDGEPLDGPAQIDGEAEIQFGQSALRLERAARTPSRLSRSRSATREGVAVGEGETVIGRDPGPDGLRIDDPTVSRRHAVLRRAGDRIELRDLGSVNGTFVNGRRVSGVVLLGEGDKVRIGRESFVCERGRLVARRTKAGRTAIAAHGVAKDVMKQSQLTRILHPVSLKIRQGEFVCLIGGSGAGKSTLMNALAGRSAITEGMIEIEGSDINREFEALKQFLAFVPQREVLHELLTVRAALGYVAEFRLPSDTPAAERAEAVERAAAEVELTQHLDTEFRRLSGGQKKRACLAAEILCKPRILFLDEVTSGLDEQTDFEIMRLLSTLAEEQGTTIVCVTHTLVNIPRFCDRVVILGSGGHLVFNGAPDDALAFFGVERLGDVLPLLSGPAVQDWAARFRSRQADDSEVSSFAHQPIAHNGVPMFKRLAQGLNQFGVLVRRNLALLFADKATLGLIVAQAVIIGLFVGWAMENFGTGYQEVASKKTLITLMIMSAMWMGSSGASKDIVSEAVIFQREKDVNLSTAAYLAAKLVTGAFFVLLQIAILFTLVTVLSAGVPGDLMNQFVLLVFTGVLGVANGLLISACSASESQATAIVPLALIPQLILIGSIVPKLPDLLKTVSGVAVPTNVMREAMTAVFVHNDTVHDIAMDTSRDVLLTARALDGSLWLAGIHFVVCVGAAFAVLLWRYRSGVSR